MRPNYGQNMSSKGRYHLDMFPRKEKNYFHILVISLLSTIRCTSKHLLTKQNMFPCTFDYALQDDENNEFLKWWLQNIGRWGYALHGQAEISLHFKHMRKVNLFLKSSKGARIQNHIVNTGTVLFWEYNIKTTNWITTFKIS